MYVNYTLYIIHYCFVLFCYVYNVELGMKTNNRLTIGTTFKFYVRVTYTSLTSPLITLYDLSIHETIYNIPNTKQSVSIESGKS